MTCWDFKNEFLIGIRLITPDGSTHPQDEELVALDTGYDGDVLIPYDLFLSLKFDEFEDYLAEEFLETASGEILKSSVSRGFLSIPKIGSTLPVQIETFRDNTEFLIGVGVLRQIRVLLDGPSNQTCIVTER
ncbi:MAG: hypothetical protein HY741_17510 [Chloroflexi bacterium]|nr:hypothetical protein [Chloroflexota bacterium]